MKKRGPRIKACVSVPVSSPIPLLYFFKLQVFDLQNGDVSFHTIKAHEAQVPKAFVAGEGQRLVANRRDKRRRARGRVEGLLVAASAGCVSGRGPGT